MSSTVTSYDSLASKQENDQMNRFKHELVLDEENDTDDETPITFGRRRVTVRTFEEEEDESEEKYDKDPSEIQSFVKTIYTKRTVTLGESSQKYTRTQRAIVTTPVMNQVLPRQAQKDHGKLTVVLDLDETLVTTTEVANMDDISSTLEQREFFITLPTGMLKVHKRPHLETFLKRASKRFELILFTAGTRDYAVKVLRKLDPLGKIFRHFLSREHCIFENNKYSKDLDIVNRDLKRTILVDNSVHSFCDHQLSNGILIKSYDNHELQKESDKELLLLYDFIKSIEQEEDVRIRLSSLARQRSSPNNETKLRSTVSKEISIVDESFV